MRATPDRLSCARTVSFLFATTAESTAGGRSSRMIEAVAVSVDQLGDLTYTVFGRRSGPLVASVHGYLSLTLSYGNIVLPFAGKPPSFDTKTPSERPGFTCATVSSTS